MSSWAATGHHCRKVKPGGNMRRVHNKTRSGCRQCKLRRVKCDEKKPTCSGCGRNDLTCSFHFLTPNFPRQPIHAIHQGLGGGGPTADMALASDPKTTELLHHYSIHTSRSMSRNLGPSKQEIWAVSIPQLALGHDWLMHSMLAISALHLLSLQPSRKEELITRASRSESLALPMYRRALAEKHKQNIHAVFAFAGFAIPYVLALSSWLDLPSSRIPDRGGLHWFLMARSLTDMLGEQWVILKQGPFAPLLNPASSPIILDRNPDDVHLAKVHDMLKQSAAESSLDKPTLNVCRETLDELRRVAALHYAPVRVVSMISAVYIWPGSISQAFVELLHQRLPEALVILAHYCVLLKFVDSCWYMKGVGEKLLVTIIEELDDRWRPWIMWALDQPCR